MTAESQDQAQLHWQRWVMDKGLTEPARDPAGRARIVRALLIANAAVAVLTLAFEAWHLTVLADTTEEEWANVSGAYDASDTRLIVVYSLQFLVWLTTAGFFIAWLYRIYRNLAALGAYDLRHGSGWAIGGWFVPILNLFRPKEIVNDSWRASDPEIGMYSHRRFWEGNPVPALFMGWWLLYLLSSALDNAAGRFYANADTVDAERTATIVAMSASVLTIPAALLAMRTVTMITERQAARAAARERMATPVPQVPVPQGPPPPEAPPGPPPGPPPQAPPPPA